MGLLPPLRQPYFCLRCFRLETGSAQTTHTPHTHPFPRGTRRELRTHAVPREPAAGGSPARGAGPARGGGDRPQVPSHGSESTSRGRVAVTDAPTTRYV